MIRGRVPPGFHYSCLGAMVAPRHLKWSHSMARYTVGQLMAELDRYQPEVIVFWDGARRGVQLDTTLVEAMLRERGIYLPRNENHTSPFLLALPRPGWAVLSRNPRRQ